MPKALTYIFATIICIILMSQSGASAEEYVYKDSQEGDYSDSEEGDGDRLVGGKLASTTEFPFMVGWNSYGTKNSLSCSGLLITPTYVLSASHCNEILIKADTDRADEIREECVSLTARGRSYTKAKGFSSIKCRWLQAEHSKDRALELVTEPKGLVYSGVEDIERYNPNMEERILKRHIRHPKAYRGGATYGTFGGYDITLLEIDSPMPGRFKGACLPGPKFDDIREGKDDSILSGYGRYFRDKMHTCQTNRHGPMKFHYCDKSYGDGAAACKKGPPPQPRICKSFLANHKVGEETEEVKIQLKGGRLTIMCNKEINPEKARYGWCHTNDNLYREEKEEKSWGFCSRDCYLDEEAGAHEYGAIRKIDSGVHILPEKQCKKYVDDSLPEGEVEVYPRILCVAKKNKWREETWVQSPYGFRKIKNYGPVTRYGSTTYVASAGTCNGDSGGPVFVKDGDNFVVTGVVSGGRGPKGKCGGINNPVHYARVKRFSTWLFHFVDKSSRHHLCWDRDFQSVMKRGY